MIVYIDGGVRLQNPGGYGTWGWSAQNEGRELAADCGLLEPCPTMSNNVAEYTALIKALEWLESVHAKGAVIRSDSTLVVKQVNGWWPVHAEHLVPLAERAKDLLRQTRSHLRWVPRERNQRADELAEWAWLLRD